MRMQAAVSLHPREKSENIFELGRNDGQSAVEGHHDAGTALRMSRGVPEEEVLREPILSLPEIEQPAYGNRSRVRRYGWPTRTGDLNRRRVYPRSGTPITRSIGAHAQIRSLIVPRKGRRQSRNNVIQMSIRERKFESLETGKGGDDLIAGSECGYKAREAAATT